MTKKISLISFPGASFIKKLLCLCLLTQSILLLSGYCFSSLPQEFFYLSLFPLWIQWLLKVLDNFNQTWQTHSFADTEYLWVSRKPADKTRDRLVRVESLHRELNHVIGNKLWENWHLNNSLTKTLYSSGFDSVSSWKITVVQLWKNMYLGTLLIWFALISKTSCAAFSKGMPDYVEGSVFLLLLFAQHSQM